jgi:hypothetical protein
MYKENRKEFLTGYDLIKELSWEKYEGQVDSNVTYFFLAPNVISRLRGESKVLYIGKTTQCIKKRYDQETNANNSPKNTQQTNIRTTYIYKQLKMQYPECYYTKQIDIKITGDECKKFLEKLKTWDKKFFLGLADQKTIKVPLEKYFLVSYADKHLEVPPLNNRV